MTCLLMPCLCMAEVSDKVVLVPEIWGIGLGAAVAGFFGTCFRPWALIFLATAPAYWFTTFLFEIHFSDIAPTLHAELGTSYYAQTYAAIGLWILGLAAGWILNKRRSADLQNREGGQ
ncbi:MAG: hypothetical protein HEQ39_18750 [Rhizobacter sp.]